MDAVSFLRMAGSNVTIGTTQKTAAARDRRALGVN
jgi:hypothetical protein